MDSGEKLRDTAGGFPQERRESSPSVAMLKLWGVRWLGMYLFCIVVGSRWGAC